MTNLPQKQDGKQADRLPSGAPDDTRMDPGTTVGRAMPVSLANPEFLKITVRARDTTTTAGIPRGDSVSRVAQS
jgi:hypothetical protein